MSEAMKNQADKADLIAAFLDDELAEQDLDALLEQLECSDTRAQLCRHSMIGGLVSGQQSLGVDISLAVREAIAQEPAPRQAKVLSFASRRQSASWGHWKVPAAGFALAASMAMLAVVVVKPAAQPQAEPALVAENSVPSVTMSAPIMKVSSGQADASLASRELVIAAPAQTRPIIAQWSSADGQTGAGNMTVSNSADMRERLNTYLINHARYGGGQTLPGSLGYARVAASPQQKVDESQR